MANRYGYLTNINHILDSKGKTIPVTADNPLPVASGVAPLEIAPANVISSLNSTATPLGAGDTFTGVGEDVTQYSTISLSIYTDVGSAPFGLKFQFSNDNVIWYTTDEYTYYNSVMKTYSIQVISEFFRVVYVNNTLSAQSVFEMFVTYKAMAGVASSHRIGDTISNEDDAQLVKAVLSAETTTGDQVNITASPDGGLHASVVTPTGSLPVSQLTTLHDGKTLARLFPEINEIQGTATGTFQDNKYDMSVTAGQWMVYQSKRFLPYFSGKPQKVELTFDNFAPEANVTKRVGYFSSNTVSPFDSTYDGFWLESSNGTIHFVIQRAGVTVLDVDIADWTAYDFLDNYQTLSEWDNFTVIEFNFLWLGGAYIELRVVTDGGFTTAHKFIYAGTSQDVFIKSPNQPVRYEIRSTTGTGNFRYICNQVATSGSIDESANSKAVDTGSTAFTISSVGTKYPILAIRKNATYRMNPVRITSADILVATTADRILWTLEINPTLSAALTYGSLANSNIQYAVGNGTITVTGAGTVIANGYLVQGSQIQTSLFANNYLAWLSGNLDGTQDEYVLCATPITTSIDIFGSINLVEG